MNQRERIGTIAQVLLSVLFLSVAALLLSAFTSPGGAVGSVLINALSEVGPLKCWLNLLYDSRSLFSADPSLAGAVQGTFGLVFSGLITVFLNSVLDSVVIGLCIHFALRIAQNMRMRGAAVLPTVLGALAGCALCGGTGLISRASANAYLELIIEIIILIIGISIMLGRKMRMRGNALRRYLLPIVFGALMTGVLSMYVSVLTLTVNHVLAPALPWVTGNAIFTSILMIGLYALDRVPLR